MIGLDTLLFTREGFKKLRDIDLYEEVLTPFGVFEPIMKMSKIGSVDKYIKLSTDEVIACSGDLGLPLYNEHNTERMIYVDDIKDKKYFTTKTLPYESKIFSDDNLYEKGTEIPQNIDNSIFILSTRDRYDLMCGLMDTPICLLKSEDGVYEFRPHSKQFEKDLVALFRLFGFPVKCCVVNKHRCIRVGVQNIAVIDDIPIRDKYKDFVEMPPDNRYRFMPLQDNGTLKKSVDGRCIEVNGGLVLIGYSLIPVKCQIL